MSTKSLVVGFVGLFFAACTRAADSTGIANEILCPDGYLVDDRVCNDIDQCDTDNGGCAQTCTNNVSSFRCSCDTGYAPNVDGASCDDINECDTNNGSCEQTYTNSVSNWTEYSPGGCIEADWACNGWNDCADGIDEGACEFENCANTVCRRYLENWFFPNTCAGVENYFPTINCSVCEAEGACGGP